MNQDNDQQRATEVDPQVSKEYASLAGEKTPQHLDQAVLREATRALRADNRRGSFGAWFRPVAFMAMLGLSLAIILDLSDTGIFRPVADTTFETTPAVPAPPASDVGGAGGSPTQPALNELKRQEKLGPADAPEKSADGAGTVTPQPTPGDSVQAEPGQLQKVRMEALPAITPPPGETVEDQAGIGDAFTVEAGIVEQHAQKAERSLEADQQSRPGTASQFAAPQAAVAIDANLRATPVACSDEQKAAAEEWWKCIESLRQAGLVEAADEEYSYFRQAFPDFALPE
jgi:hypothetical protein